MIKQLALTALLLIILYATFLALQTPISKLGEITTYTEVPKYIEDIAVTNCYLNEVKITETEYKNLNNKLTPGIDIAYCNHPYVLNTLQDNQYFISGKNEASSTIVTIKYPGQKSTTKLKSEL